MKKHENERVERLRDIKRELRENYSRLPFGNWFRKLKKQPKVEGVELEKNDVLAMILAVLSLVLPWVLSGAAIMVAVIMLLGWIFGVGR